MNKNDFIDYIKSNVKDYLPPEYESAAITSAVVTKENDTKRTGLLIKKENESVTPTIYVEQHYERYQGGQDIDTIVGDIADMRIECERPEIEEMAHDIEDYEKVKNHLQIHLCEPERNKERLKGKVFDMCGDYAAVYYVNLKKLNGLNGSIPITNSMMEHWEVGMEKLHADAIAAEERRKPSLVALDELIISMQFGIGHPENFLENGNEIDSMNVSAHLFCLTNESNFHGASLIFNEHIQEKIGKALHDDYYVIPSSVHECLIIPQSMGMRLDELNETIRDINATEVLAEEVLSDKALYYDRATKVLENAETRQERLNALEKEQSNQGKMSIHARLAEKKQQIQKNATVGQKVLSANEVSI